MAAFDEPKSWIAIFVGFLVTALGLIPLLNAMNVISFTLPKAMLSIIDGIALWLIAGVALLLFIDALWEDDTIKTVTIILSIALFSLGIIQILSSLNVIGFGIPFLKGVVSYVLMTIEGLFLIIAAFAMD